MHGINRAGEKSPYGLIILPRYGSGTIDPVPGSPAGSSERSVRGIPVIRPEDRATPASSFLPLKFPQETYRQDTRAGELAKLVTGERKKDGYGKKQRGYAVTVWEIRGSVVTS